MWSRLILHLHLSTGLTEQRAAQRGTYMVLCVGSVSTFINDSRCVAAGVILCDLNFKQLNSRL